MKKLKKLTSVLLSLATAAAMILPLGLNASAQGICYKWTVDRSLPNKDERMGWVGNGKTNFSVDTQVHTDNSWYSIKLENTDYNISYVERTYNVEPNTHYKFSAMVKYSGYQLATDAEATASGGCIGEAFTWSNSGYTTSNDWRLMEYNFTTKPDQTTINLNLQNGIYDGHCKGTAWFSDVKLEKAELTNNWDILAVFFKNADANVTFDGKPVHHQLSLRESDITAINTLILDKLPETLKTLSSNKMRVNSIDRYYVDEALTEKDLGVYTSGDINGYSIDYDISEMVGKTLDTFLAKKHYNQIIIFVPLSGINGGWWGLGGKKYKNVHLAQITNSWDGAFEKTSNPPLLAVHEITHGLERESKEINDDKTPLLHDKEKYSAEMSDYDWYKHYMNRTLPDGKGLDPSVFYRPNGNYTLVDNDMTTGVGITPGSDSVTPPAPKNFRAESVSDENIKFSWDALPNADGFQFVRFKSADHEEAATAISEYKADKLSATWGPFTKGKTLYYGLRAVYSQNGKTVYSEWTYLTFTHARVDVIFGDIDNSGKFDLSDITAALHIYVNSNDIDPRILSAAGISGRTKFQLNDIIALLQIYVNS